MPEKFEFYYKCFCCGYLVSDIEYESAISFVRCPRCHAGVENFVPEAHLTKRVLDGGDSAPLQAVSTPEVLSLSLSDSASRPAAQ